MDNFTKPSWILENPLAFLHVGEKEVKKISSLPVPTDSVFSTEQNARSMVSYDNLSYSSFVVLCRSDGASMTLPQKIFIPFYYNSFKDIVTPIFNKSIANLLNIRNHLALQLDLECGNISEDYFDKEEKKYLSETKKVSFEQLKNEVQLLYEFSKLPLDAEDISEMLNCPFDDAEKAVKNFISEGV